MPDMIVNDFSMNLATPNGTGSQTSNNIIYRTLFHMGLAASAKNLFPSNIQGLPTWYRIRVSPQGWQTRSEECQVLLTLNPETWDQDLKTHPQGGVVIDNADYKIPDHRFEGFTRYSVPFDTLALKNIRDAKLRPKLKNLIYVGVIAQLFGLEDKSMKAAIESLFPGKQKIFDMNWNALELGRNFAKENFEKSDPYRFEPADQTEGKIMIEGNESCGLGAVFGGCTVLTWYPITPATSLGEAMIKHFHNYRINDKGERKFAVLQAEDELAAIGMVLGAGWAGARAATSTSGPGVSLMAENLGYAYYTEIPCVLFDVQRVGPSTGLPTRTAQGDILQVAYHSHGDTLFPMLLPGNAVECFEFSWKSFDVAERYQTPITVMTDLDLGMNQWISDPLEYPDQPFDRGKVLDDADLDRLEAWGRYKDMDGDGIPIRSIAGHNNRAQAAYFTRGSGHDAYARYSERDDDYEENLDRLARKLEGVANDLPGPLLSGNINADLGVVAYGTTNFAVEEALAGLDDSFAYLRLRAFPFNNQVEEFVATKDRVIVIEQNQQGQMAQLLRLAYPEHAARIKSVCYYGGLPLSANFVVNALKGVRAGV